MSVQQENIFESNTSTSTKFQVYARFSPLINGPRFLPIHAEIMLCDCDEKLEAIDETKLNGSDLTTSSFLGPNRNVNFLHRVDFIPLKPTDPSTLMGLVSFQDVEGLVRYRKVGVRMDPGEDTNEQDTPASATNNRLKELLTSNISLEKCSIVLPLGSVRLGVVEYDSDKIRMPECIVDIVNEKSGMKLNLLQNNCYSFAFDVLSSIRSNGETLQE